MKDTTVSSIEIAKNGAKLSRIVFGAWRLAEDPNGYSVSRISSKIQTCLEVGITSFDHADIYGNYSCEEIFGAALAESSSLRHQMQLITKCGIRLPAESKTDSPIKHYDTSSKHILASVNHSLKSLRTDYIDLLLIHRPDPLMDPDEIVEAFQKLRQQGKVLYFGVSNFSPIQFDLIQSRLPFSLVTNQIEASVLKVEPFLDGTITACQLNRICPMAWSPLGGGALFQGNSEREIRIRETLLKIGNELGHFNSDQIALAWLIAHPAKILPILGTNALTRIKQGASAEKIQLSRGQWFEILAASTGKAVP